jgi:murein DD-endopeptidase MepM/ murein hydrolase activator NlpD
MAKRFFTVLILPDATAQARKFHITRPILTVFASLVAVGIMAFAFFLYQYVSLNLRMIEVRQLRQEVGDRSVLAAKITQLEGDLSRLREFDQKLRVVAGLDQGAQERAEFAQGGAGTLSRTALMDTVQNEAGRLADLVTRDIEVLGREITSRERSFRELKTLLEEKRSVLASTPTIWPVKGLITAGYGYRQSPFTGAREMHEGLDIAAPYGSPILATADGIVSFAGPLADFGNVVFVNHGHGFTTFYAHTSKIRVKEGQSVKRGDVVAYVGTTGRTTGPHVHYEVQVNGLTVNPMKYIVDSSGATYAGETEAAGRS